jgi:hypothetical protein
MENISVHDNHVLKYLVDHEKKEIILYTKFEDQELTDIVFSGVAAYLFEDTIIGCIIMDIEEWPAEDLISCLGEDYLMKHKNYGWPFDFQNTTDFIDKVKENGVIIYNLASSYGMSGFIFAKSVKYSTKKI